MAKTRKLVKKSTSKHNGAASLQKLSFGCMKSFTDTHHKKKPAKPSEKKVWKNALCSVCMESPHNAVLLLCSSYEKGCRPYMCATSHRFSNCLEQYKNTSKRTKIFELLCPLCRGEVKGWTLVNPARKYLNAKKRTCMHDNCSFFGNYKDLRKHVKFEHPSARPRDLDPSRVEKWKKLENERTLSDVFSTIRSTMPGAIVVGDYVIERGYRGDYSNLPSRWYNGASYHERFGGAQARPGTASGRLGLVAPRRTGRLRVLGNT